MFNHSLLGQNVGWKRDVEAGLMVYSTLRDIREGEELFITYGANLTFEDVEKKMMEEEAKKEDTTEEVWGRMDVEGLL